MCFALAGCENNNPNEPLDESGVWSKSYGLYSPINQIENITCDLYYRINLTSGAFTSFGSTEVDIWRSYELEERNDGEFLFEYTTTAVDYSPNIYEKSLTLNYGNAAEEVFYYVYPNRVMNTDGVVYIDEPEYYFTYIVEKLVINDKIGTSQWSQSYREWTIRAYAVFNTSDVQISLHEYVFRRTYRDFPSKYDDFLFARLESQSFEATIYEV